MNEAYALLDLQKIDIQLMRAQKELQQKHQLERMNQFEKAERKLNKNALQVKYIRKDLEIELSDNEEQVNHLKDIVAEVQKNFEGKEQDFRAVKELQSQLVHLAKRIEKLDFNAQSLQKKLERAKTAEKNAELLKVKLQDEKDAFMQRVEAACKDTNETIARLQATREQIVQALSKDMLTTYDSHLKKYGGLAVERLNGNKPSICRVALQPSQYQELIASKEEVVTCPYCRRMLVVIPPTESENL